YDSANNLINTACRMEPNNLEYRQMYNQLNRTQNSYRSTYYGQRNNSNDMCSTCMNIWMLDTLCECLGGDCISGC
ncbi:MAG: molecular chaperone DnaJ, partial [Cellulosilyticaceae bacterium]